MKREVKLVLFNPRNKIKTHKEVTKNLTVHPREELLRDPDILKGMLDRKINCGRVEFAKKVIESCPEVKLWCSYWTRYPWILRQEDNPGLVIEGVGADYDFYDWPSWQCYPCWLIGLK